MKKFKIFLISFAIIMVFTLDGVLGMSPPPNNPGGHHHHRRKSCPVGAPLDGGLLAILGAAGVAYFVARKKKSNE